MQRLLTTIAAGAVALGMAASYAQDLLVPAQPPLVVARDAETPVRLERVEVDVEPVDGLARTTVLLTLRNPNARQLEGSLEFPLQPGQQLAGFALDIDGAMRDAVPVPKERGRQVFESIERRNVDPGLLEQVAGNHFRLRVYPLPAGGTRQVRLVLDEPMQRDGGTWRLALPMHLLVQAPGFVLRAPADAEVRLEGGFQELRFTPEGGHQAVQVPRAAVSPGHGLVLRFPAGEGIRQYAAMHADAHYALAVVPVDARATERALPSRIGLLWDASASGRRRDHAAEFALLDRYFRAIGNGRVVLRLLRDRGEDGGRFEIRDGDWSALRAVLAGVVYDGASDLADWTPEPGVQEYLLVGDGLHNYGERAFPALGDGGRLYAIAAPGTGAGADAGRLAALAEARGGRLVAWQGVDGIEDAARRLLQDAPRVVALGGEGVAEAVAQSRWLDDGHLRVAARLLAPRGSLRVELADAGGRRVVSVPVSAQDAPRAMVPQLWAAWTLAGLAAEPERNRAGIVRLGTRFGLATQGTSLLVLDDPMDYVRHDIPAPPALQARVDAMRAGWQRERQASRGERLDQVAAAFRERQEWWKKQFPKGKPPAAANRKEVPAMAMAAPSPAPGARDLPPPPPVPSPAMAEAGELDSFVAAADAAAAGESRAHAATTIRLQPWEPDSAYARRLRDARPEQIYALYLDERDSHVESTAFYLDVADLLLKRGRRDEALRVLSNLAELQLESRHVLRVLGYRLMQAEAYPLAVQAFRRVLEMAGEEPQSHRDLGLALAAAGDRQQAIRHLYDVVAGDWDRRFAEVELVALNELNQIVATSPAPLDTGFIDPRLLGNLPLDLRVVLAWDSDNSDMDLWVTDPNGEKCYYANQLTYQGGLMSDDFTGGYGPEEFLLRDAKPGKYKVQAHYFGDRQQVVTGATTLTLRLSTGWGTGRQRDQVVTLRLSGRDEEILVGEFEVK